MAEAAEEAARKERGEAMNILIEILESIMKAVGTIKVEQDTRFGIPILIVRSISHLLGPGQFDGILTRDEAEEAYRDHIAFLDVVGDEVVDKINKMNHEMWEDNYPQSQLDQLIDKMHSAEKLHTEVIKRTQAKVYLIKAGDEYKIGFSSEPEKRINGVTSPSKKQKELLLTICSNNPRGLESFLHGIFTHRRISGEWYLLSDIDIEWIKQSAPYLEKRFDKPPSFLGIDF